MNRFFCILLGVWLFIWGSIFFLDNYKNFLLKLIFVTCFFLRYDKKTSKCVPASQKEASDLLLFVIQFTVILRVQETTTKRSKWLYIGLYIKLYLLSYTHKLHSQCITQLNTTHIMAALLQNKEACRIVLLHFSFKKGDGPRHILEY